jgi:hypothetical protein
MKVCQKPSQQHQPRLMPAEIITAKAGSGWSLKLLPGLMPAEHN